MRWLVILLVKEVIREENDLYVETTRVRVWPKIDLKLVPSAKIALQH